MDPIWYVILIGVYDIQRTMNIWSVYQCHSCTISEIEGIYQKEVVPLFDTLVGQLFQTLVIRREIVLPFTQEKL